MRLKSEIVVEAEQGLNCLGDRELVLRNLAIPVIENLALAKDSFDVIDLTSNIITTLGDGFPPFPRLETLYVGQNRIERIESGLASSLPNLKTLILNCNRISSLNNLNINELKKLKHLEVLSILDNPIITSIPNIRQVIIHNLPKLKVFNFTKVLQNERNNSTSKGNITSEQKDIENKDSNITKPSSSLKRKRSAVTDRIESEDNNKKETSDISSGVKARDSRNNNAQQKKQRKLTTEQSEAVRKYIESANSVEQVNRLQEALQNGTVLQFLTAASMTLTEKG